MLKAIISAPKQPIKTEEAHFISKIAMCSKTFTILNVKTFKFISVEIPSAFCESCKI